MNEGLNRMVEVENFDLLEEYVPFWHIVFHGIVLNNPYAGTVNAIVHRNPDSLLRLIELGGRPVIYYYSKFVSDGSDWMGDIDFRMDTKEEFEAGVKNVKKTTDIYKDLSYLQFEFMEKHEKIDDNVYKTTYSDNSEIIVDYNQKTYSFKKGEQ